LIDRFISLFLSQRALSVLLLMAIIVLGVYSVFTIPTDSFPDVSNVQVQIITETEALAAEEVESLITVPIEYALNGLPFVKLVRSSSEFGLSVVTAIFDDNCDVYFARQLVQQRLTTLTFPPDVERPQLGPVISTFSQVFLYHVSSDRHDLIKLRAIQDWDIARKLLSVQGVANVTSYGGYVKQYQVIVDRDKLAGYGLSLQDVAEAITASNHNVGGNIIEAGDEEITIRGIGRVNTLDDINNIVLKEVGGTPVLVRNIARVVIGPAFRRGSGSMNGKGEAIIGTVLTRKGANTKQVVESVEHRLKEIAAELPEGVTITPLYNQKDLVDKTSETVREILFFSGALVIIILTAILLNIRTALIVCVIIPLSLLFSFFLMKFTGLSSNLMTLGAVDFGVVVDSGVVVVENIYRRLSSACADLKEGERLNRLSVVLSAAKEVGRPVCFAIFIIVAVYLPLFTLEGVEGKMFQPLALTFVYAIMGALLVSLTMIPVMCFWFMRGLIKEKHNPVVEWIKRHYEPLLLRCLSMPGKILIVSVILLAVTSPLLALLGSEFMPTLDEGSALLRLRMPPSISHTRSRQFVQAVEKQIKAFPEVTVVATRVGRSGMGSEFEGIDNADMFIGLEPKSQWRIRNKDRLIDAMDDAVSQIPGIMFSFSQPIADMVDDLVTGVKADVGIKIFGDDLHRLEALTNEVKNVVMKVRGAADVSREPIIGAPQLSITLKREALARYGLHAGDVNWTVQAALAGKTVSEVIEGKRRFNILVRISENQRNSPEQVGDLKIQTPTGAQIPLRMLADITLARGAIFIAHENSQRRAAVMVNVRERDLGGWVQEAMQQVNQKVHLPHGYRIVWGGQFENQQRAMTRLAIVVPVVLALIFTLLFFTFNSIKNAGLIMLNVPFATIGGIISLWISQQPISVPAIIGFIAVFGVAVQNGVILTSCIMQLQKDGQDTVEAIRNGCLMRLRPVLMTATVAMMGLIPKLISDGIGAEIQRPLATVVFGGLLTSTIMTLLVLPALYKMINKESAYVSDSHIIRDKALGLDSHTHKEKTSVADSYSDTI
jgi:heavy metal efflux system protein